MARLKRWWRRFLCWIGRHDYKVHLHKTGWERLRCQRCAFTKYDKSGVLVGGIIQGDNE
jgi:hypothetical protein